MAARVASARLLTLERLNYGLACRFTMEPHAQLEQRLLEWASLRLYGVHIEYDAIQAGKKIYTINSDGMWLLSHLFENWEEMDRPPARQKVYQCDHCHMFFATLDQCPECKKMLCPVCSVVHIHLKQKAEEPAQPHQRTKTTQCCWECGRLQSMLVHLTRCSTCQRLLCAVCLASHLHTVNEDAPFTAEDFRSFYGHFRESGSRQQRSSTGSGTWSQASTNTNTRTRSIPVNVREALQVLGVALSNPTIESITARHRQLAKEQHPDLGGNHAEMVKINNARDVALKWVKAGQGQKT